MLGDTVVRCWETTHLKNIYIICIPVIVFIGILTPIYILSQIFLAIRKNEVNKESLLRTFGYFVLPFAPNRKYFDSIVILRKLLLVFLRQLFLIFRWAKRDKLLYNAFSQLPDNFQHNPKNFISIR